MAERREDPPLRDEHPTLDLGFVARPPRARRDDRDAVVLRHLEVGRIDVGLVTVGPADCAAKLIGDGDLRHRAEVLEGANGRTDEVGELLRARRLREGVVARAEHGDEELDLGDLAGFAVDDARPLAGVVDEDLLASAMHLAHHDTERLLPAGVEVAEAAVLVGPQRLLGRRRFTVLDPDCLERHARPRQLSVHPREVDSHPRRRLVAAPVAEQPRLELHLTELARALPREPEATGSRQVVPDGALPDPERRGDLRVASPALVLEPQDFSYLPHRHSLRHRARVRDEVCDCARRRSPIPGCPGIIPRVARNDPPGAPERAPESPESAPECRRNGPPGQPGIRSLAARLSEVEAELRHRLIATRLVGRVPRTRDDDKKKCRGREPSALDDCGSGDAERARGDARRAFDFGGPVRVRPCQSLGARLL